jgi:hypothetical protein
VGAKALHADVSNLGGSGYTTRKLLKAQTLAEGARSKG